MYCKTVLLALLGMLLSTVSGCCVVGSLAGGPRGPRCLKRSAPSVGRPVPDEVFALMTRELARARDESTPPLTRARILEQLPRLFPDVSDLLREPTCSPDLVRWMERELFAAHPIPFDRITVARVRAAGGVGDTTGVMEQKAAFLMRVAVLPDDALTDYRPLPEEGGPLPERSFLRQIALANLGYSGLRQNVESVLPFLRARLAATTEAAEPAERALLIGLLAQPLLRPGEHLREEPAAAVAGRAEALRRVAELEEELETLNFAPARCHVLRRLARWLPPDLAIARFAALTAPIFREDGKLHLRTETLCRLGVALGLEAVPPPRRITLLRTILELSPEQISEYDFGGDEAHPAIGYDIDPMSVRMPAARALAAHPEWALQDPLLQAWLLREAAEPLQGGNGNLAESRNLLGPVFELLLAFHLGQGEGAEAARGRQILEGFLATVETVLQGEAPHSLYGYEALRDRIQALRIHGEAYGRGEPVTSLLERVRKAWGAPGSLPVADPFRLELLEAAGPGLQD